MNENVRLTTSSPRLAMDVTSFSLRPLPLASTPFAAAWTHLADRSPAQNPISCKSVALFTAARATPSLQSPCAVSPASRVALPNRLQKTAFVNGRPFEWWIERTLLHAGLEPARSRSNVRLDGETQTIEWTQRNGLEFAQSEAITAKRKSQTLQ